MLLFFYFIIFETIIGKTCLEISIHYVKFVFHKKDVPDLLDISLLTVFYYSNMEYLFVFTPVL